MKKLLEVEVLDVQPDWNNVTLPAGIYYTKDSRSLWDHNGTPNYFPISLYVANDLLFEDILEPVAKPIKLAPPLGIIQHTNFTPKDVVDLVLAVKVLPENVKFGERS